jgi:hypothetical protein
MASGSSMSKLSLALRRIFVLAIYAAVLAVIFIAAYVNDRSYYAYFWIAVVVMSRRCSRSNSAFGSSTAPRRAPWMAWGRDRRTN